MCKLTLKVDHGSNRSTAANNKYIFVLFNAFETLCSPQCMMDISQLWPGSRAGPNLGDHGGAESSKGHGGSAFVALVPYGPTPTVAALLAIFFYN